MTLIQFLKGQKSLLKRFLSGRESFTAAEQSVIADFHRLYYDRARTGGTWMDTRWLGCVTLKYPQDLWVYQEILQECRPDLVVETGTCEGGSALYMASIMDLLGTGQVVTIDIEARANLPKHPRIRYVTGSSTDPGIVADLKALAAGKTVMVILDSDHSRDHVLRELQMLSPLVTPGNYVVVEDTNINGHPVNPEHGPGPMEAMEEFFKGNTAFEVDERREKFFLTANPRGYWRRK